jgi:hypothetical protein
MVYADGKLSHINNKFQLSFRFQLTRHNSFRKYPRLDKERGVRCSLRSFAGTCDHSGDSRSLIQPNGWTEGAGGVLPERHNGLCAAPDGAARFGSRSLDRSIRSTCRQWRTNSGTLLRSTNRRRRITIGTGLHVGAHVNSSQSKTGASAVNTATGTAVSPVTSVRRTGVAA